MANTPSHEAADSCSAGISLAPTLLIAAAVVLLGTAWVDPARIWLLVIPASLLLAAFAAGVLANRATGGLPHESGLSTAHRLAIHLGVGLACLAVLAVWSALCGVFRITWIVTLVLCAYGMILVIRAMVRFRPSSVSLPVAAGGFVLGGVAGGLAVGHHSTHLLR